MTELPDDQQANSGRRMLQATGVNQNGVQSQTRRLLLRSLGAGATVAVFGTGLSGAVQNGTDTRPKLQETPDWLTQTQRDAQLSMGQTDQECPPTTFTPEWESDDLDGNINQVVLRRDSADDGTVFATGDDNVALEGSSKIYAFDREDGSVLPDWPIPTERYTRLQLGPEGTVFYMNATSDESTWNVGSINVDAASTDWEQSFPREGTIGIILYDDSRDEIHTVTNGPTVTAFDPETGDELWSWSVNKDIPASFARRAEDTLYVVASPFIARSPQSRFSALDLSSPGKPTEKWHVSAEQVMPVYPGVGQDYVAIGLADQRNRESEIRVLEADDGTERWRDTRDDSLLYAGRLIAQNGGVYGTAAFEFEDGTTEGEVRKFNADDGTVEWSFDADGYLLGLELGPNSAYTQTTSGDVFAIQDETEASDGGNERWSQTLFGGSDASVAGAFSLDCDTLYTGTTEKPGVVYAIDAENGNIYDEYTVGSGVIKTAYPYEGSVWAVSGKGVEQDEEDTENRVYRLGGNNNQGGDETVSVSVEPDEVGMDVDGTTQANLQVTGAESGISEYTLSVSVGDLGVAVISNVSVDRLSSGGVDIADDGSSATIDVDLGTEPYEQETVIVATVTLQGVGTGETTLAYDSATVVGSSGTTQEIQTMTGATVAVPGSEGPPPVVSDRRPTDPDGDGRYEDIDGDGEFTIADVSAFFELYRSQVVRENVEFFDFDGDETVTLDDVRELYSKFTEE